MKNMRINPTENVIEIEYKTAEKAFKIYDGMYDFEQKRCVLCGDYITYDLTDVKFENIILVVRDLFRKSFDDGKISEVDLDIYSKIVKQTEAIIDTGKLFKVTLIKPDGTIGKYGFGCWQYGRILNLNDFLDTFKVTLRNSNIDDKAHEIIVTEEDTILIEIGEIQF